MTNDFDLEEERARALSRSLRGGVRGDFVPNPDAVNRPPTPAPILGPRGSAFDQYAAEDKSKRRRKLDDAEEEALKG